MKPWGQPCLLLLSLLLLLAEWSQCQLDTYTLQDAVEDVAVTVVSEAAKLMLPNADDVWGSRKCLPRDCADIQRRGQNQSGVYRIWIRGADKCGNDVYCDLEEDGGGWTVIQRRGDFGKPKDFFYRRWRDYKFGFGNISEDFWLGNDVISQLTNQGNYVLKIVLWAESEETRHAQYGEFYVEPESANYILNVHGYTGDAGDSLTEYHSGKMFSTWDRDNDIGPGNCAKQYMGAWWYKSCCSSDLNGVYEQGHTNSRFGVYWKTWMGNNYSYHHVVMKVRPKDFL